MVFDYEQAIPLSSINPAKVRDFDLMDPELWLGEDQALNTACKNQRRQTDRKLRENRD